MSDSFRIFAIGDLHLPGGRFKPMDVFGEHWNGHFEKIAADWTARVSEEDVVLIPGDISWALKLEDAREDLMRIGSLPGTKIMIRGNHDFWWASISRLRASLPKGMLALQNNAALIKGTLFAGSRGWNAPEGEDDSENERIYRRELLRLELSFSRARALSPDKRLVAMTHFPPTGEMGERSPVTELMTAFGVSDVVYGHLHGQANNRAFEGTIDGVRYFPSSCDGLGFRLRKLPSASVPELLSF